MFHDLEKHTEKQDLNTVSWLISGSGAKINVQIVGFLSLCLRAGGGVQSEAGGAERPTWGRRLRHRSPPAEWRAPERAARSKSAPPRRNVPSASGWRRRLCRCSTQGGETFPSASPPSPWQHIQQDQSLKKYRGPAQQRLKTRSLRLNRNFTEIYPTNWVEKKPNL